VELLSFESGDSWPVVGCENAVESVDSARLSRTGKGREALLSDGMSFTTGC
jgi:hypothetical protein